MSKKRALFAAFGQPVLVGLFALASTSGAAFGQVQGQQTKPAAVPSGPSTPAPDANAAAAAPSNVEGVTVSATLSRPSLGVPPDKAAAYAAQVAQDEALRKYRRSTPPLTKDPNDMSKDYPGLQTLVPQQ